MKTSLFTLCFIFKLALVDYAQSYEDSVRTQQSYLFDHFVDGRVLLKSGDTSYAPLNYSSSDQSIVFLKGGRIFSLTNLSAIDSIFIGEKKFVPVKNSVYEIVPTEGKVKLLISYTLKMKPLTATTDHSGTSKQSASEVNNTVSNVYVSRNYKGDFTVEITKRYWLCDYKNISRANHLKDFLKVFRESTNEAITNYVKENNVDFSNEAQLIKLTNYCNKL